MLSIELKYFKAEEKEERGREREKKTVVMNCLPWPKRRKRWKMKVHTPWTSIWSLSIHLLKV